MTPTSSNSRSAEIAALNDEFRRMGPNLSRLKFDGLWLVTQGVQAMGPHFTWSALLGVMNFAEFLPGNDPYGEHDFGALDIDGTMVFWKIDYLERGTPWGAEDPADNARTCRMITIMMAGEY